MLLCLGALICVLALSIGIEARKGKNGLQTLSSSKLEKAIQRLLITKDIWFDAFRYKCILTYLNEIRASPQGRVCCASKVLIYPTFASRSYDINPIVQEAAKYIIQWPMLPIIPSQNIFFFIKSEHLKSIFYCHYSPLLITKNQARFKLGQF